MASQNHRFSLLPIEIKRHIVSYLDLEACKKVRYIREFCAPAAEVIFKDLKISLLDGEEYSRINDELAGKLLPYVRKLHISQYSFDKPTDEQFLAYAIQTNIISDLFELGAYQGFSRACPRVEEIAIIANSPYELPFMQSTFVDHIEEDIWPCFDIATTIVFQREILDGNICWRSISCSYLDMHRLSLPNDKSHLQKIFRRLSVLSLYSPRLEGSATEAIMLAARSTKVLEIARTAISDNISIRFVNLVFLKLDTVLISPKRLRKMLLAHVSSLEEIDFNQVRLEEESARGRDLYSSQHPIQIARLLRDDMKLKRAKLRCFFTSKENLDTTFQMYEERCSEAIVSKIDFPDCATLMKESQGQ